jgi:ADP-heptose:LPS heptosyltransferase
VSFSFGPTESGAVIELTGRAGPELLALRALKLGDLLVVVPALKGLRRQHPEHRIVLASPGWLLPIVRLVDAVDALLPTPGLDDSLPRRPGEVDIAVNLHGSGIESAGLVSLLAARLVVAHRPHGVPAELAPQWRPHQNERERWVRLVNAFGADADADDVSIAAPQLASPRPGATVVHIGAFYGSRRWAASSFAEVTASLRGAGHQVVLTGSEAELPRAHAIARLAGIDDGDILAGTLDLEQLAALIAGARCVVSADTGPAHLASAYGTPSVVLFGPAAPELWGPPPGPHLALTHPELRRGETFSDVTDPALEAVTPIEVLDAVQKVLAMSADSGGLAVLDRRPQPLKDAAQQP